MSNGKAGADLDKFFKNVASLIGPEVLLDHSHRVSEQLAARMLDQMGLTQDAATPFKLFDNACGIGAVNFEIHRRIDPQVLQKSTILCGDFTEQLIVMTEKIAKDEGWVNTEVKQIDGQNTGLPSGEFTHVTTNIGFHVTPNSNAALDETIRILKPGGILGFTTFERIPGWALEVQSAFKTFPFEAPFSFSVQTTRYGEWGSVNWIRKELASRGLEDVKVELFAFLSHVDSADFFISNIGTMVDWVVKSNWSEELQKEHGREEYLQLLREYLVNKYGVGGWDQSWVAIVSSGRVPLAA